MDGATAAGSRSCCLSSWKSQRIESGLRDVRYGWQSQADNRPARAAWPVYPPEADIGGAFSDVGFVPILLQKSKIVRRQKSREIRFLGIPIAAKVLGADTKVRGRFCVKRYGPSHREARDASAALKISVHRPKNTFATISANSGPRSGPVVRCTKPCCDATLL
jgi:hypothetical protein